MLTMSGHVYLFILSSRYSATVVYSCVTLGVTDGSQAGQLKQIFRDILGPLDAILSATRQDNATMLHCVKK